MKVMYFDWSFWGETKGGTQRYLHEIVKRARKELNVIEIYKTNMNIKNAYTIREINICLNFIPKNIMDGFLNPFNVYIAKKKLVYLLEKLKPNIFHTQIYSPYIPKDPSIKK